MRRVGYYLVLALVLLGAGRAFGQAGTEQAGRWKPMPPALDGSMMPIDFGQCNPAPWLPDSLRPVYASYVARHGARYLSGPKKLEYVMKHLEKGRNSGTLSATGEAFLKLMTQVQEHNEGNWGELSPLGVEEERELGKRIFKIVRPLAKEGARVNAVSSYMPRVVMTMYQFTHMLVLQNDRMSVRTDEGPQYDSLVCCFIADKAYSKFRDKGDWREIYDKYVEGNVSGEPARRLFTRTDMDQKELKRLTMEMYEVLKSNRASGLPAPTTQWMSVREYEACWEADNLKHWLRNSATGLNDLALAATEPLLLRMISDADDALCEYGSGRDYDVMNGYFGHCETLLPLLSLMRLPACATQPELLKEPRRLQECWKVQELAPLGGNLLLLFSEGPSGQFYVTMQLNGRTMRPMPGEPDIVPWNLLRNYWAGLTRTALQPKASFFML